MDKTEEELKICLFGYYRNKVNNDLKEMKLVHEEKIQELKKNLSVINEENRKLSDEIQKLKDEIEFEMKSEQFMKFALKKVQEVVPIISKVSSEETSRITLLGKKEEEIFNKKIEKYNNIIKSNQEELNLLLKKQLEKSESLSENVKKFIKNRCYSAIYEKLSIKTESSEIEYKDSTGAENDRSSRCKCSIDKNTDEYIDKNEKIQIKNITEKLEIEKIENQSTDKIIKTELKSADVKEDINRIRNKYLIGKLAGEDLVDSKGNIIVSKDSIITEEIIIRAEKEGKLPKLIVNMAITDI